MYPPDGSPNSLPRLRLRSMYAEKPEDNLLFQVSVPWVLRWKHLLCVSVVLFLLRADKGSPLYVLGVPQRLIACGLCVHCVGQYRL
jgi:hypothetical protein